MPQPDTPRLLENRCYDELAIGESASLVRTLTQQDIELFAILSGDINPAHLDEAYARETPFHHVIAHGMWGGTLISSVLGTRLPGPGTIYVKQSLAFLRPVGLGDAITVTVTVKDKLEKNHVVLDCVCTNQLGKPVITGEADVIAPSEKVRRPASPLPELQLRHHERFVRLMDRVRGLPPARCVVTHPLDAEVLRGAMAAQQASLIEPLFLGPRADIEALAQTHGIDLSPARWHDSASAPDHAAPLQKALNLIDHGEAEVLMPGGLPTLALLRELMRALLRTSPRDPMAHETHEAHKAPGNGPSTSRRDNHHTNHRISHTFIADVPGRDEPLLITDAALNIQPSLHAKRDIAQNAIDLAVKMGLSPRVAVLSAANTPNSHLSSSVDAMALRQMAEQGQITGGIVDGPLPFDAAISPEAARVRHAGSPVAGQANVLLVPNLETGDMLVKQLVHLAHADVAGIVLGARGPVILQSATDTPRTRLASAALALLQARATSLPTSGTRT